MKKLLHKTKDSREKEPKRIRKVNTKLGDWRKQLKKNLIHEINDSKILGYSISYQKKGRVIRIIEGNKKDWEKLIWKG